MHLSLKFSENALSYLCNYSVLTGWDGVRTAGCCRRHFSACSCFSKAIGVDLPSVERFFFYYPVVQKNQKSGGQFNKGDLKAVLIRLLIGKP